MNRANFDILNNYWGLIKNLRDSWKVILIERLQASMTSNSIKKTNKIKMAFGAWESEDTADEMIQKLRDSRSTNRHIETL